MTVKLSVAERKGKSAGHSRICKVLGKLQDVRSIKFAAADIGMMIASLVLISVVVCIMTIATTGMGCFSPQQF
ncbi:hypothetical protein RW64_11860 [Geobacter sulfurreducens]|nr:hypothetical protein RW64_11860 [Geobacter sulfurreducens]